MYFILYILDQLRDEDEIWYNANQNEDQFERQWQYFQELKRQGLGKIIYKFTCDKFLYIS
jgi:hypothetical protein